MKKYLNRVFVDGLGGMALGLFSTLIIGTILTQIADVAPAGIAAYIRGVANLAKTLTGAGIGAGVASRFREAPLVTVSAAVAGMIGAFPSVVLSGENISIGSPGEPLGAFIAAFVAIECGRLVSGKTGIDILLTPIIGIGTGAAAGFLIGPYISAFMRKLGELININVEKSPIIGGIIVSVAVGMILTLPISSAAIAVSMGISGLAAGAATVGCCCQMVGFAVASYRENGPGGLISQGIGTSMLQMPNIVKKPLIWLPPIIASAVLGPVSSAVLKMTNTSVGAGMGTSGLVGPIAAYGSMTAGGMSSPAAMIEIMLMHFILPGALTFAIAKGMKKAGWIGGQDMKLRLN